MLPYFNQIQRHWQHRKHKTQYEDKRKKKPSNNQKNKSKHKKMNYELMLTYDTPALRQTGSRNLTGQKTLPTIWVPI